MKKVLMMVLIILAASALAQAEETLTAEQWAEKLSPYKADTKEGSKGVYGVPTENVEVLKKTRASYDEAKALYDAFKKTGMDPNDDWRLRQAEYDVRIAIENYERSVDRVIKAAEEKIDEAQSWIKENPDKAWLFGKDRKQELHDGLANAAALLPAESPRLKAMQDKLAEIGKTLAAAEAANLEKVRMKPDVYKGKDATAVKAVAKSVVLKAHPKTSILRVNVISKTWERESVVEYTDTTNTALQHRITDGLNVQVAAKEGGECLIYTVFVNKNKIGGKQGGLQGHIMFEDKILEKNVGK